MAKECNSKYDVTIKVTVFSNHLPKPTEDDMYCIIDHAIEQGLDIVWNEEKIAGYDNKEITVKTQ